MRFHRGVRLIGVLAACAIVIVSLVPLGWRPHSGAPTVLEHFSAYALCAVAMALGFPGALHALGIAALLTAGAGVLEIGQIFATGRTPQVIDFFSSACGALFGMLIGLGAARLLDRGQSAPLATAKVVLRRPDTGA
jgi:hypothetical protein